MSSNLRQTLEAILRVPAARGDRHARDQRVMAATVMACAEHGYAHAKVSDIAKTAGVSTATLYRDYKDRDGLFIKAIEFGLTLIGFIWRPSSLPDDPLARVEAMLTNLAQSWGDPFLGSLIRMYVQFSISKAPHLLPIARVWRDNNRQFWLDSVAGLVREGFLVKGQTDVIVAIMLGAIERRTIFSRLAFGEDDKHQPDVTAVVSHTALAIFQVFGTEAFWANRQDQRAPGWCGDGRAAFDTESKEQAFWIVAPPKTLMDAPSKRLSTYANRVLSQDYSRTDIEGRKLRIQLAAMLECIDHGYEGAGMAGVATRAEVSTATLYLDYADKTTLFVDAMLMQARFRVDYGKLIAEEKRPQDAINSLVYSIAAVLADPNFVWYHYVSMASELSSSPELIASSRATRTHSEGFVIGCIDRMVKDGVLAPCDLFLTMNLLLGPTQRRSILSMVLYGADDVNPNELARLASISTEFVLRLVGQGPAATT